MKIGYTLQEVAQIKDWFVTKNIEVIWSEDYCTTSIRPNPDNLITHFVGYVKLPFVKQSEFRDLDKNTITVRNEISMYFSVHTCLNPVQNSFHFHKVRYGRQRDYRHKEFYDKEFDKVLVWSDVSNGLEQFLETIKIENVLDNKAYSIVCNNKVSNYQPLTDRLTS
jgi:hypothetical protein